MVPIFDINNDFSVSDLPYYKRLSKWIQNIRGSLSQISYIDYVFRKYMNGSDDLSFYDNLISYHKNDFVINEYSVFQSLSDNNLGNLTSDTNFWYCVLDSFIGRVEVANYVCRKLPFEFFINHYFKQQILNSGLIGFKNPTSIVGDSYSPNSDIFIENVVPVNYSITGFDDLHI